MHGCNGLCPIPSCRNTHTQWEHLNILWCHSPVAGSWSGCRWWCYKPVKRRIQCSWYYQTSYDSETNTEPTIIQGPFWINKETKLTNPSNSYTKSGTASGSVFENIFHNDTIIVLADSLTFNKCRLHSVERYTLPWFFTDFIKFVSALTSFRFGLIKSISNITTFGLFCNEF